jgi:ABC-2 type transport system permease protein
LTKGFLDYLSRYADFVTPMESEMERKDALFFRRVVYILTIPEGFSESFLSSGEVLLFKEVAPDSKKAISIDNAVNNYLNLAKVYLSFTKEVSGAELNSYITKNLEEETEVIFEVNTEKKQMGSNTFNKYYFNYLGYIMLSSLITGISLVMYSFHGLDIRRRHFASPVTEKSRNFQLILANSIYVAGYLLLFIVAGYLLNKDRELNFNVMLCWLNAAFYAITCLSISYLIGITVKSRSAIQAISTALSLSLAFISGMFGEQQYMGASVLKVASFTPAYWYVKANNTIEGLTSLNMESSSSLIWYLCIQLGFAAAIISIALVISKRKRVATE